MSVAYDEQIQAQTGIGQEFEIRHKCRLLDPFSEVSTLDIAVSDAEEELALVEALQILAKVGLARVQETDGSNEDRVGRDLIQHPLVVLQPRARLLDNRADDAKRLDQLSVTRRQRADPRDRIILRWPCDTLRPPPVEQMNVGVDDRRGSRLHGSDRQR